MIVMSARVVAKGAAPLQSVRCGLGVPPLAL